MKLVAQLLAFILTTYALASGSLAREAHACSPFEAGAAKGLRDSIEKFIQDKQYEQAESSYVRLAAMDASCIVPHDHSLGGTSARKLGNLHNAYVRFTTAGDTAGVAALDKAYGKVRIMNAANAPSPRLLTWVGVLITSPESRAVIDASKKQVIAGGKSVLYLLPAKYLIKSGSKTLLEFEVKAGDELLLEYK